MEFINLTPHDINIVNSNNEVIRTFPPSGIVARVEKRDENTFIDGIELVTSHLKGVINIPPPKIDTLFIVSTFVMQAVNRRDVVSPANLKVLENTVYGCTGFKSIINKKEGI